MPRKRAREALRESERQVRKKLETVLSPQGDLGELELADLIDASALQALMNDFYTVARIPMGIMDLKGKVLVGIGWQEICIKFHRMQPETLSHCLESDIHLLTGLKKDECRLFKCKNNMWDMATPIIVSERHVGNIFTGQFLFEDEIIDYAFFRSQAIKYGFNEEEYLAALDRVPRLKKDTVDKGMSFFIKLAETISRLGYSNAKLARLLAERERLTDSLQESRKSLEQSQQIAHVGSWELDHVHEWLTWSDEVYRIFGLQPQEFKATYEAFLERVHPEDREAASGRSDNLSKVADQADERAVRFACRIGVEH